MTVLADRAGVVARRHWPLDQAPAVLARIGLTGLAEGHERRGYALDRLEGSLTSRGHLRLEVRWVRHDERAGTVERHESLRRFDRRLSVPEFLAWRALLAGRCAAPA